MEKEFIPYELALRMKALDYDGPCFAYFLNSILQYPAWEKDYSYFNEMSDINSNFKNYEYVLAPTWQSAFKWFREKYNLVSWIRRRAGFYKEYSWYISDFNNEEPDEYEFDLHIESYEEAELDCLTKLIEIVESKSELK
jgi:hypothetical protein